MTWGSRGALLALSSLRTSLMSFLKFTAFHSYYAYARGLRMKPSIESQKDEDEPIDSRRKDVERRATARSLAACWVSPAPSSHPPCQGRTRCKEENSRRKRSKAFGRGLDGALGFGFSRCVGCYVFAQTVADEFHAICRPSDRWSTRDSRWGTSTCFATGGK